MIPLSRHPFALRHQRSKSQEEKQKTHLCSDAFVLNIFCISREKLKNVVTRKFRVWVGE